MLKSKNFLISIAVLATLSVMVFTCAPENSNSDSTDGPKEGAEPELVASGSLDSDAWQMPVDVSDKTSQDSYFTLGWDSFIALIWPADDSYPGKPDTSKKPGDAANNLVWESFKEKYQIFLPEGAQPPAWTDPIDMQCGTETIPAGTKVLGGVTKNTSTAGIEDEFDEAGVTKPLIDQYNNYIRFEIRVCESEFQYIYHNQYYNGDKQKEDVNADNFAPFPRTGSGADSVVMGGPVPEFAQYGATEVKASWRILEAGQDASRYYSRQAYLVNPDGTCSGEVTIGLVGLHILRLTPSTPSTWYWATFEQVDNVDLNPEFGGTLPAHPLLNTNPLQPQAKGYSYEPDEIKPGESLPENPTPVLVTRTDSIPNALQQMNLNYSNMLKGTVWQYYQMVGAVNPPTDGHNVPKNGLVPAVNVASLYNTTMETYTQGNCVNCHSYGFPQGASVDTSDTGNQIFTFLLGDAQSPGS